MANNINKEITLSIKKLQKDQKLYGRRHINESFLSDYKKICDEIKSVNPKKFENLNVYNSIEIHLYHPELNEIAINNEEDWKFLYNYNIIQECAKNNKIRVDFELKNPKISFNININDRKINFRKIKAYIMKNIPQSFYFNIMIKFFNEYIDLAELFKYYVLEELVKTDLNSIKKEINKNCDDIKKLEYNFDNEIDYKSNDYTISTPYFFSILKYNSCKNIIEIKNIIGDINKENENIKNLFTDYNTSLNIKNEGKKENNIESEIEADNNHFTSLKLDNNCNKLINENKLFNNIKKDEYYAGIEGLKDHFNKENINKLYESDKLSNL